VACVAKIGRTRQSDYSARRSVFSDFADGLTYVKNSPFLLTVIVIVCTFGAFGMAHNHIVPAMAKDVLTTGAAGVGLLFLGSGIGAFMGSLILPMIQPANVYRSLLFSLVIFTFILTLFAWSSWFWLSWILFLLVGLVGKGLVWPLATTVVQLETPLEVRGRVMGVLHITPAVHYLGAYPLALAAGQWDWAFAITGSAMVSLGVTAWYGLARRGAPKISRPAAP
jgi:MFS family permease